MSKLQFAVQMFTLRDHIKTRDSFEDALSRISKMGYTAVQLSAVGAMNGENPEVDAKAARALLDKYGLKCIATHRSYDALLGKTDAEIEFHKTLGCDYTAIGGIPGADSLENYRQFLAQSDVMISRLHEAGIRFGVHNHSKEFAQGDGPGRWLFDALLEEGSKNLAFELDLYWVQHAGVNPIRVLEKCAGRCPVIHIKDKRVDVAEGPVMAPIGEGNLEWDYILPACREAGVQWVAVEQDKCQRDPFDCLRSSFDYLSAREW